MYQLVELGLENASRDPKNRIAVSSNNTLVFSLVSLRFATGHLIG
jgi:hypothetical protein